MALFLITAPSGVGKTTLVHSLMEDRFWRECISHTTRLIRHGEVDGKTYHFISKDEFSRMYENGEFAESVEYDMNYYGLTKEEIDSALKARKHAVAIVEYNGYKQIKEKYPEAVGIFLHMSKEDCMANMLIRGDSISNALNRVQKYDEEIKYKGEFDYVVKNIRNQLGDTKTILKSIIMQYS